MKLWFFLLLGAATATDCLAATSPVPQDAQTVGKFTLSTGFDYSTGKYGQTDSTDIVSVPLVLQWEVSLWTVKLTVPYLRVSGPSNVIAGVGALSNANPPANETRSGLGDVVATASYYIYNDTAEGLIVDLSGEIKFGTASSSRGLGTGKEDFEGQMDIYKSVGSMTPFASFGYRLVGSPAGVTLNNVAFGSLGVDDKIVGGTNVGASFLIQERMSSSVDPAHELTVYVSHRMTGDWRVQGYVLTGFTNASPKFEVGGMVGHTF